MSISRWMDKQTVVCPYKQLLSSKKVKTTDIWENLSDSQGPCAKSQKITYWMIPFIWHSWKNKPNMMENRPVVVRGWGEGTISVQRGSTRVFFFFPNERAVLIVVVSTQVYTGVENVEHHYFTFHSCAWCLGLLVFAVWVDAFSQLRVLDPLVSSSTKRTTKMPWLLTSYLHQGHRLLTAYPSHHPFPF